MRRKIVWTMDWNISMLFPLSIVRSASLNRSIWLIINFLVYEKAKQWKTAHTKVTYNCEIYRFPNWFSMARQMFNEQWNELSIWMQTLQSVCGTLGNGAIALLIPMCDSFDWRPNDSHNVVAPLFALRNRPITITNTIKDTFESSTLGHLFSHSSVYNARKIDELLMCGNLKSWARLRHSTEIKLVLVASDKQKKSNWTEKKRHSKTRPR